MANVLSALSLLFAPGTLLMCFAGAMVGLVLGAIPGMAAGLAITVMLPISFTMEPTQAFALLISIWVGGCSGSFIGSILLGIPGTASSLATTYDGYAMTKKGQATRALSIGTLSNFMGTAPSVIIAMVACPIIASFAVKMGPWEYFALSFMAITLVVSVSKGNMVKGFLAAGLGLLLTQVGYSPISSTERFTFGSYYLAGGFSMSVVMIGIFAGSMIILSYARKEKAAGGFEGKLSGFHLEKEDLTGNIGTILTSFLVGLGIGFLPGMGAALSNMVAYATAKNSSKNPDDFGTGVAAGIWAPEVANNASVGGAIIPMVALGIPGDGTTAMLLGGLTIHGLEAGPLMLKNNPVFCYMIFLSALLAALMVLIVEIFGIRWFPYLLKAPTHYLYPTIMVLCLLGVYIETYNVANMIMTLFFFAIGLFMSYAGMPSTPFILAFVLGKNMEKYFRQAVSYSKGDLLAFFKRPVSCILLIIAVGSVVFPLVKEQIAKRKAAETQA